MSAEVFESPRAKEQKRRQAAYDGFETVGQLVDKGETTWEAAIALLRNLGGVAVKLGENNPNGK